MKKQVIFVDDEPRILEGLRRAFRGERDEWEMRFAVRGADALGLLKTNKVDVLVTDMCMPGMDGAEVLHQARRLSPATVRVVLSGQFSKASGMRALPVF